MAEMKAYIGGPLRYLVERLENEKILQSLELCSHHITLSRAFAECFFPCLVKQVKDLDLNFELNDDLATILGQALSRNDITTQNLTKLNLRIRTLSAHAGFDLAQGLSNNPQISILQLKFPNCFLINAVGYAGSFYHLCSSLPNLMSLTNLHIQCNLTSYDNDPPLCSPDDSEPFHPTQAEVLMLAITNHPTLLELDLSYSLDYGFHGLHTIARLLGNRNIKIQKLALSMLVYVKFPDKNASTEEKEAYIQMGLDSFGEDLVESLKSNFHLCDLQTDIYDFIDWNKRDCRMNLSTLPSMADDQLDFFVNLNKKGRHLLCHCNFSKVPPSLWCNITAGCGNSPSLVFGLLHEITPNGNLLVDIVGTEQSRKRKKPETMQ